VPATESAWRPGLEPGIRVSVENADATPGQKVRGWCESAGRAGQHFRHCVLTHLWRRPGAVPAVDTPVRGCDSVTVAAGDLFVIEKPGGGGYGAPPGSGASGGGPGV